MALYVCVCVSCGEQRETPRRQVSLTNFFSLGLQVIRPGVGKVCLIGQLPVLKIKFYCNTAIPIYLCIVCGCFCAMLAELSSCRDCMAHKT